LKLFKTALGIFLEKIINTALKTDPDYLNLLKIIHQKYLEIGIQDFDLSIIFIGRENKLEVIMNSELGLENNHKNSAVVSGDLINLLKLIFSKTPQAMLASKLINLQGEVGILQAYQEFAANLNLDWESRLADLIGPLAAAEIGKMARESKQFHQKSFHSSVQDFSEYLTEEIKVLPSKQEVQDFYDDLRDLKLDIERLEARVKRAEIKK